MRRLQGAGWLALAAAVPGTATAQWTPALWVDLVQMPVAVTRLELAGVPVADLRLLVPALNLSTVTPGYFLETVRILPLWGRDEWNGGLDQPGMGRYVRTLHQRGLRGTELASAIHEELRRRGVPAGGRGRGAADARDRFDDRGPGVGRDLSRPDGPRGGSAGPQGRGGDVRDQGPPGRSGGARGRGDAAPDPGRGAPQSRGRGAGRGRGL